MGGGGGGGVGGERSGRVRRHLEAESRMSMGLRRLVSGPLMMWMIGGGGMRFDERVVGLRRHRCPRAGCFSRCLAKKRRSRCETRRARSIDSCRWHRCRGRCQALKLPVVRIVRRGSSSLAVAPWPARPTCGRGRGRGRALEPAPPSLLAPASCCRAACCPTAYGPGSSTVCGCHPWSTSSRPAGCVERFPCWSPSASSRLIVLPSEEALAHGDCSRVATGTPTERTWSSCAMRAPRTVSWIAAAEQLWHTPRVRPDIARPARRTDDRTRLPSLRATCGDQPRSLAAPWRCVCASSPPAGVASDRVVRPFVRATSIEKRLGSKR